MKRGISLVSVVLVLLVSGCSRKYHRPGGGCFKGTEGSDGQVMIERVPCGKERLQETKAHDVVKLSLKGGREKGEGTAGCKGRVTECKGGALRQLKD